MEDDVAARLEAFENRRIYKSLDVSTIAAIPDDDVEMAIVDYVHLKLKDRYDQEPEIVRGLSLGARALYLTWTVEAEVNNGGFNQYYFNTNGTFAKEAEEAFAFFGAKEHQALMREANVIRASEASEMAKFKEEGMLEAFSESYEHTKLGPLDSRFYKIQENLSTLRVARIRDNPELFVGR